ncbi:hypothetical protein OHA80_18555 [Streptomyces niveus]
MRAAVSAARAGRASEAEDRIGHAKDAAERMDAYALHDLKGLTTCSDDHTRSEVQNDLVGAVIAALLAMHYIDPTGARATFDEILHRRTRRGREVAAG